MNFNVGDKFRFKCDPEALFNYINVHILNALCNEELIFTIEEVDYKNSYIRFGILNYTNHFKSSFSDFEKISHLIEINFVITNQKYIQLDQTN